MLISPQWGRVSISIFLCYIGHYLHYGFKISMLLKYNILLVIYLLRWLLNIVANGRVHVKDELLT